MLRYERRKLDDKGKPGSASLLTVYGHDLDEHGHYRPATIGRGDLPAYFGLSTRDGAIKMRLALRGVVPLAVRGKATTAAAADGAATITTEWSFASRGKERGRDRHEIDGGSAAATTVRDVATGRVRSATVRLAYTLVGLGRDAKREHVEETWELRFAEERPVRWKGQQEDINACIDRGAKFLRTLQKDDGDFVPHGDHVIGSTALALLTLRACGAPPDDPAVRKGLAWLVRQDPDRNYDRAVALMAIDRCYTSDAEARAVERGQKVAPERALPDGTRDWCHRVADALESASPSPGMWDYTSKGAQRGYSRNPDASNSQYAVLGLRAAARLGYPVREQTWLGVIRYFESLQERGAKRGSVDVVFEGEVQPQTIKVPAVAGFRYRSDGPFAWGSMTCAGIASLAIACDELERAGSAKVSRKEIDRLLFGGWAWLDRNWNVDRNPRHPDGRWTFYYLYSLERAGILTNVKRVGGKDWYVEGAIQLLAREKKGGGWGKDVADNCFALLFLRRATSPVTR